MRGIKNLTHGPIDRQLLNLVVPIMVASFIQMVCSLTDMVWVERLGSKAIAATGSVGVLMWTSGSIFSLSKAGSEVSIGQSVGVQNQEDARQFASHNTMITLIISICWGGLLSIFTSPVIRTYELEEHITVNAIGYLRTISITLPSIFLLVASTGIYNVAGRGKIPSYTSGTGPIINIILDSLFIFGFGLGTNGAVHVTWLLQVMVLVIFIYQLRLRRDTLLGGFSLLSRPRKKYMRRTLKLGLPVVTLNTLLALVNTLLCRTTSEQGGHIGLITSTTGGQIEAITWNTSWGFSTILSALIAQSSAAERAERVLKVWCTTLWMTGIFRTLYTLLSIFYGNEVFSVFAPEQVAYEAGGVFLRIDEYSQLFMMLEITMQGMFCGVGRTASPATVSIVCNYMRVPLAILSVRTGMGVGGIWWAVCVTAVAKGLTLLGWSTVIRKECLDLPSTSTR